MIGFIIYAAICAVVVFAWCELRAKRDEKLGIYDGPERRNLTFPKAGPHAFKVGDLVKSTDPNQHWRGTVEGLYWPEKPWYMPAAHTTMPVRCVVTGNVTWWSRYDVEKV
jgi:hypothetical protein